MKRHLIKLFLTALVLALIAGALAYDAYSQLTKPLQVLEQQNIELQSGSRMRDAVSALRRESIFTHPRQGFYLEIWARLSGDAAKIKAGEYRLDPGLSSLQFLQLMVDGKTVLHEVQFVEGLRFDQAMKIVAAHPELVHTLPDLRSETVMAAINQSDLHPEGRFFPDTYRFSKGTTDVQLLKQAFDAMAKVLAEEWDAKATGLPYSQPADALIMASIVEKETGLASEREQIAGVFVRRLVMGMRLQTDPTVIYGIGESFDGNLRKRDLLTDGPYNTYQRTGLPPSPICLPGRAAIRAALHPADGKELFFVSRGDGSHKFSVTLAEHEAAVRKYQLRRGK